MIFGQYWRLSLSGLASLGYTRASVPIVSAVDFSGAASFAAADRMQSLARAILRPLTQSLQSWVYTSVEDLPVYQARAFRATMSVATAGGVIGVLMALLLPNFGTLLFSDLIPTGFDISIPLGIAIASIGLSGGVATFYLVPLGATSVISNSLLLSSIVAVPAIVIAAFVGSPLWPLVTVACVEIAVAIWQVIGAFWAVRKRVEG